MDRAIEESVALNFLGSFILTGAGLLAACDVVLHDIVLIAADKKTEKDIATLRKIILRHTRRYKSAADAFDILMERVLQ